MTERLDAIFDSSHAIATELARGLSGDDVTQLRDMALGRRATPSRSRALDALVAARLPQARETLQTVLADRGADDGTRAAAAAQLGRLGEPQAEGPLAQQIAEGAPHLVRLSAATALGKIGTPAVLDTLDGVARQADRAVGDQLRFSASLIAYRNGLAGHELPVPGRGDIVALDRARAQPVTAEPPATADVERALASPALDRYGVEVGAERAVRLRCGPATLLVLVAPDADSTDVLVGAPQLGGIVATQAPSDGTWSTRYVIATWPGARGRAHLALHGTDGRQAYYGTAAVGRGGRVTFSLDAVAGRGTIPLVLRGTAQNGRVALTEAHSSVRVVGQAAPAPG